MEDTDRVIDELLAAPLATVEEARATAPGASGFYSWWCERSAVPSNVPAPPHPAGTYALLYIGVAPNSPASASNLRKRIRQHTSANIGSSTFRLSLTALLWEKEGWKVTWTDRPALDAGSLASLGRWQSEHLAVRWSEASTPWSIEPEVIAAMRPPMNRSHNERNPFYTSMGVARNNLRRAARVP
jgi:hypothetical protein